jgi:hypothetical protein
MKYLAVFLIFAAGVLFIGKQLNDIKQAQDEAVASILSKIENAVLPNPFKKDAGFVAPEIAAVPEPTAVSPATARKTMVQHWFSPCPACEYDVKYTHPQWRLRGWNIRKNNIPETQGRVPWYDVVDEDGLQFRINGQLTVDSYDKARKDAIGGK